ncbi:microtubule-associated protein RP/EB family member 2-like [Scaptodrosophila lebanonensis]|uniref:Microtubule-associated protein RP/EB family member 2-like n=1 Tax=Drosophila lebanonensis TaxID=7225 RepID=A0A6J2U5J7_DROLE|nr:microtubule-associated protein RP/EB family member 2-like [Scaptodrosophila lebanonensis]
MVKLSLRQLLSWANDVLQANFSSLDEFNTGSAYLQIIHRLFPQSVSLRQIKFYTNYQFEMESNYNLLKKAFKTLNINYPLEIKDLQQGRHYETLNWLHTFYLKHDTGAPYDALAMRQNQKIGLRRGHPTSQRKHRCLSDSIQSLTSARSTASQSSSLSTKSAIVQRKDAFKRNINPEEYCIESLAISLPSEDSADDEAPETNVLSELEALKASEAELTEILKKVKYYLNLKEWAETPQETLTAIRKLVCRDENVKLEGEGEGDGPKVAEKKQSKLDAGSQ